MLAIFVAAFVVEQPLWQLPLLGGVVALLAGTGSLPNVWRLRWFFVLIFVSTLLIWTFFYGPDGVPPLATVGPLVVSRTAPWFGLGMALKLVTFLASGLLFLSTTRIEEFAYALTRVGLPYKVGFTMTMAFRLVPVFVDAAATVIQAQRCRGLDFEHGSPWQRVRRYVPVIVPVFMGALRRADGMAMALEARGFQSRRVRTVYEPFVFRVSDAGAMVVAAGVAAGYVALWYYGYTAVPNPAPIG
jgi:energy-coupling factor transport system permease protein